METLHENSLEDVHQYRIKKNIKYDDTKPRHEQVRTGVPFGKAADLHVFSSKSEGRKRTFALRRVD